MRDYLECQAFVVHLRHEHKQIHQAVSDIEHELASADSPDGPARMSQSVLRLRATLVEHFDEEEQGGCLEQAVSCVPRLSADVAEIEQEHAEIVQLIDGLIERSGDRLTVEYHDSFRQFAKTLRAHEAAENRILQTAFGTGELDTDELPSAYGDR